MNRLIFILLASLFLVGGLAAQTLPADIDTNNAAPGQKPSRIYSFQEASMDEILAAVRAVASPDAKIVPLPKVSKIYVQDDASHLYDIGKVIAEFDLPKSNVRIDLTFEEATQDTTQTAGVEVKMKGGTFIVNAGQPSKRANTLHPNDSGAIVLNGSEQQGSTVSHQTQFLVTRSGSPASIRIGEDVPVVDYFYAYAMNAGLIRVPDPAHPGQTMVVSANTATPEIRWESVGTSMSVTPTVIGNRISVEIVPEITAMVDMPGLNPKLTKHEAQTVYFRDLATTIVVDSGAPVFIGGFNGASDDFNHKFFASGKFSRTHSSSFTLKATILPPGQMY